MGQSVLYGYSDLIDVSRRDVGLKMKRTRKENIFAGGSRARLRRITRVNRKHRPQIHVNSIAKYPLSVGAG